MVVEDLAAEAVQLPLAPQGQWAARAHAARRRAFGQRSRKRNRNLTNFARQAEACNSLGRSRTADHLLPLDTSQPRASAKGKGQWKVWTPEAVLRAAFAKEVVSARAIAAQVDGSSGSFARETRPFIAQCLAKEQEECWKRNVAQAQHEAGGSCSYVLCNMMFDETELEVSVTDFGPAAWSILASHSQLTIAASGQGSERDVDIVRHPRALPTKQATTMCPVLCAGPGGLLPGISEIEADVKAVMATCDAGAANLKLLRHLQAMLPSDTFSYPYFAHSIEMGM